MKLIGWLGWWLAAPVMATTISVMPIYEPLSLHGTDVDDVVSESGEVVQATLMARPMALTGAFPEVLVESIRTPHRLPSNNPNYKVQEVNLLVLCHIRLKAKLEEGSRLRVEVDLAELAIPEEVDLTVRQVLKLTIAAIRKTLDEYQRSQAEALAVEVEMTGLEEGTASLKDLSCKFTLGEEP